MQTNADVFHTHVEREREFKFIIKTAYLDFDSASDTIIAIIFHSGTVCSTHQDEAD